MFPVQWSKPVKTQRNVLHFVKCPPNRSVVILCPPSEFCVIALHWLDEARQSAPCIGEGCPLLGIARHFKSAYAPCLQFSSREGRWMPMILGIGDPGHTLANEDFSGTPIVVGRSTEDTDGKRLIYLGRANNVTTPMPHIAKSFDIRANLLRRWGLFKEADLIDCEFHSPPQTLSFPETEVG